MQKKTILILLAALAVLGGLTYLTLMKSRPRTQPVAMGEKLFPDLPVNDVVKITLTAPGDEATVVKKPGGWVVPGRDGYPADFGKVARFVRQFADVKIGRTFEATPADLTRLGLAEPGKAPGPKQAAIQVTLEAEGGKVLATLLAGKDRPSKSQQMRGIPEGQYVRLPGKDTVYLVDGYFARSDTKSSEWLDTTLTSVNAADVRSISCRAGKPDFAQEMYALERPGPGAEFAPVVFPRDKKLKASAVNQLAGLLSGFSLEDVEKAKGEVKEFSDAALSFTLFDGRKYSLYPDRSDSSGACRIRVSVDFEKPPAAETPAAPAEPASTTLTAAAEPKPATPTAAEQAEALAGQENARLSSWVFDLPPWRCEKIITDTSALVETPEGEGGQGAGPENPMPGFNGMPGMMPMPGPPGR